jgi:quercetin dioxygenase-like cupin family protein
VMTRIYTGADEQTHFEDFNMPVGEIEQVAAAAGAQIVFRRFPADYFSDWHCAPRRQYIIILSGRMEIGIGDGTKRQFGPGDVLLADDLSGQGHTTASVGEPRVSATIAIAD